MPAGNPIAIGAVRDVGQVDVSGWARAGFEFSSPVGFTVNLVTINGGVVLGPLTTGAAGSLIAAIPMITDRLLVRVTASAGVAITAYWWQVYLTEN